MNGILCLILASTLPVISGFTAYDCADSTVTGTYSLQNIEECKYSTKTPDLTLLGKRRLLILQKRNVKSKRVVECQVAQKDQVFDCGMHSHTSLIFEDKFKYFLELDDTECMRMATTKRFLRHRASVSVRMNVTRTARVLMRGRMGLDGSCKGETTFELRDRQYTGMHIRYYQILMRSYTADFDAETGAMLTDGLHYCTLEEGFCQRTTSVIIFNYHQENAQFCAYRKTRSAEFKVFKIDHEMHSTDTYNDITALQNRLLVTAEDNDMMRF
jgi:hypothetical protein